MKQWMKGTVLAVAFACVSPVHAADSSTAAQRMQTLKTSAKSGSDSKLASSLIALKNSYATNAAKSSNARSSLHRGPGMLKAHDGYVRVSAYGSDPVALKSQLVENGMLDTRVHESSVSGRVPVANLEAISKVSGLSFMKGVMAMTRAGLVTSQGDRSMRSDLARSQLGVAGKGIRVGVLSDSFDCAPGPFDVGQRFTRASEDVANNDLPPNIHVLSDASATPSDACSDEGRAMMQIVHDVAPGASQSFYTAFNSEEDFANGILALADDGAKVIVDDVIYFDEPMFENGLVADAVNTVKKKGVAYFSSAGNDARQSYSSDFRRSRAEGVSGARHDFNPGKGVDTLQHVTIPAAADTGVILNWDEPSLSANGRRGSRSDVDVIFYEMDGRPVIDCADAPEDVPYCQFAGLTRNTDNDAVEIAEIINQSENPIELQLGIELYAGPAPNLLKYVWFDFGEPMIVNEWDTQSGTVYGHANAEGAEAVGGAWWFDTAAWGAANHPICKNACVNSYSSAGGTPILFDDRGQRKRTPYIGFKPGVTGPDGGNTTFFYFNSTTPAPGGEPDDFPNFFGTSAAAPHVAAVAALMLDQRQRDIASRKHFIGSRELTPDLIYAALRLTAEDIKRRSLATRDPAATIPLAHPNGFDFDSGFGLVNAYKALKLTKGF
jgi:subtilisin family serine protease